ncbi:hypothetical protein A3860_36830 [Niastella vici]|uniref:Uncharacterized protein n=1 Tax=Niastella vici TaxID=1703345 RepID=A0A1V9FN18_9BACT|nr:hypothetical protein [Niastella vici]OQP59646.1 hypothetical protein A3860_36830 [Niastella vici]
MNRFLFLLVLIGTGQSISAQYVYTIKADSVKITNNCDTAELIIENHTQDVCGFLFNKGKGRTEFRRAAVKINDTTYLVGCDTIKALPPGVAWLTNGNSNINDGVNFLGTTNGASLVFKTNNTERARVLGSTGNFLIGDVNDNGAKLQVTGRETIYGTQDVTQLAIKLPASPAITTPIVQVQDNTGASLMDVRVDTTSIFFGKGAGANSTSPSNANIAIGKEALANNTTGAYNFAAGIRTLYSNTTGSYNMAVGGGGPAMLSNTTGIGNIALGTDALAMNTIGNRNVGIGVNPLKFNVTGNYNVAIGDNPMLYNTTGNYNVAIGASALASRISKTSSSQNVAIGYGCANNRTFGVNNIFMGFFANLDAPAGDNNIGIGANSNIYGGSNNILLGTGSYTSNTSNATVIGQGITCDLSNLVILGRADQNTVVGVTNSSTDNGARLQVNGSQTTAGNLGVGGITAMSAKMHIAASDGSAGSAPVKLTAGAVLATPEDGTVEYDGSELYLTTGSSRYALSKTLKGQITTDFGGISLSAFSAVTVTLTVTGVQSGDVVNVSANSGSVNPPSIVITGYAATANTVTLRAYNASNSAVTIASDTYKVRVIK